MNININAGAAMKFADQATETGEHQPVRTVANYPDADLVRRAVSAAVPRHGADVPRWDAVSDAFAMGSTFSRQLCERFGFDPDEVLVYHLPENYARQDLEDDDVAGVKPT